MMPIAETCWRWAIYRTSDLRWQFAAEFADRWSRPASRAQLAFYGPGLCAASAEYYRIIDGLAAAGLRTIADGRQRATLLGWYEAYLRDRETERQWMTGRFEGTV